MSPVLVFAAALLFAAKVSCRAGGAPAPACFTLAPDPAFHLNAQNQTGPVPYMLGNFTEAFYMDDGSLAYVPGETYVFSVTYADGQPGPFRGFLLQGRQLVDDTTVLGTFTVIDSNSRLSDCTPANSAITHNNNQDKTDAYVSWTAPPAGSGPLRMGWAVVQTRAVYWSDLRSAVIQELGNSAAGTLAAASSLMLVISTILATLL